MFAAFYWEGKVYGSRWNPSAEGNALGKVYRYNISGNTLVPDGDFIIPGITGSYNIEGWTTDGTYIYGVNETNRIYKIDPATWTVVQQINITFPEAICIAYDPVNDGFWVGQIGDEQITFLTSAGVTTSTVLTDGDYYGLMGITYDDYSEGGPYIVGSFGSSGDWYNYATLGRWNIATGVFEENIQDLTTIPGSPAFNNSAGGIFTYTESGKFNLVGISQGATCFYAYELAEAADPASPAAPTNLTVTPGATGAFTAAVTWTNPALTVDGGTLTELTKIYVFENDVLVETFNNPTIEGAGSYDATVTAAGSYTYKVVGENTAGEGLSAKAIAWIGPDVPAAPGNVTLVKNDQDASVSWTAPTTGLHGGYFVATGIVYDVYRGNTLVSPNQTGTTFSETITEPTNVYYKIVAKNDIGVGGSANSNIINFCMTIDTFPWTEGFEDEIFPPACWDVVYNGDELTNWERTLNSYHTGVASAYHDWNSADLDGWLISPPIQLPSEGACELSFWTRTEDVSYYDSSSILISTESNVPSSGDFTTIKTLSGDEVSMYWQKISIGLGDYSGETIYIAFRYEGYFAHLWYVDDVMVDILPDTPVIELIPNPFTAGSIYNNLPYQNIRTLTVKNAGGAPLTISGFTSTYPFRITCYNWRRQSGRNYP